MQQGDRSVRLVEGRDYTVYYGPAGITAPTLGSVTLKNRFLTKLDEGRHSFEISYLPLGETYVPNMVQGADTNEPPRTTTLTVRVVKNSLVVSREGTVPPIRYGETLAAIDIADSGYKFAGLGTDTSVPGKLVWKNSSSTAEGSLAKAGTMRAPAVFYPSGTFADVYSPLEIEVVLTVLPSEAEIDELSNTVEDLAWIANGIAKRDLHPDDYPEGVLSEFDKAYAKATALNKRWTDYEDDVPGISAPTEVEIEEANAALEQARDALIHDHSLIVNSTSAAGGTVIKDGKTGVRIELKGYMPHVTSVQLKGPGGASATELLAGPVATTGDTGRLYDAIKAIEAGTLTSGSAVIELNPAYIGTLSEGDYKLTVSFSDPLIDRAEPSSVVRASASHEETFAVKNAAVVPDTNGNAPKTGDDAGLLLWLLVAVVLALSGCLLTSRAVIQRWCREQRR
jgi:hypothetical protein